jgi:ribonuclease T2
MTATGRALAALVLLSFSPSAAAQERGFDFYVLALSWSPTFCATDDGASGSDQCAADADFGFIVHGLWPQYERGYPEFCEGDARLARRLVDSMLDVMPDAGLVRHEWKKHGTCSGLSAESYFAEVRVALAAVEIPPMLMEGAGERRISAADVEAAFVAANPGLSRDGIAVACRRGYLAEVRVCLTREMNFRACAEVDADGCRQSNLRLPGTR